MLLPSIIALSMLQPPGAGAGPGRHRASAAEPKPPVEVNPVTAWKDVCDAYRAGPVSEKVTVVIKPHERPERSSDLIVRLDPGAPETEILLPEGVTKTPARPGSVLLELGQLRIHADESAITATATGAGAPPAFFRLAREGPLTPHTFRDALPPVPLPQLAAAFGDRDRAMISLTPYTPNVIWSKAVLDPNPTPATLTLSGESGRGTKVTLIAEGATGRMLRVRCEIQPGPTLLELFVTPQPASEPASWKIDTNGKREVSSLAELLQKPPPPPAPAPAPASPPAPESPPAAGPG